MLTSMIPTMTTTTLWTTLRTTVWPLWLVLTTSTVKGEPCRSVELTASASINYLIYNASLDNCAWIIKGAAVGDVIAMRVTDWFTPGGFSCSRDRLVIRDGSHISSPYLRVICGAMCGVLNDVTEVVTTSNTARISYMPFEHTSSRPRGFTLIYRSLTNCIFSGVNLHFCSRLMDVSYLPADPVGLRPAMYTEANYVLMVVSVVVIGGLVVGIVFLLLREMGMVRLKKRQHVLDLLKKRRQAFSGQSGVDSRLGSDVSVPESAWSDHDDSVHNNNHVNRENGWTAATDDVMGSEENRPTNTIPETELVMTHVMLRRDCDRDVILPDDGDMTSQVLGITEIGSKNCNMLLKSSNGTCLQYDEPISM